MGSIPGVVSSRGHQISAVDTIGRIPVMIVGALFCVLCSLFYPMITAVWAFMVLRLLHGFSTGFKPTGTTAFLADIVPADRRGEAMGILGVSGSLGMAGGMGAGGYISMNYGTDIMFYTSSLMGLLAIVPIFFMERHASSPRW